MSRDDYEFGPHHSISVGGHYLGGWAFGRKKKRPPAEAPGRWHPAHGRAMKLALTVIGVLIGADLLGQSWHNGAEIAWAALAGVLVVAAAVVAVARTVRRARELPSAVLATLNESEAREAIGAANPNELEWAKQALADVVIAAHRDRVMRGYGDRP